MRSVIIPAAGLATRMKPLSRGVSKAMIPINGRPLITYVIDNILESSDVEIIIVENEIGDVLDFVSRIYSDSQLTGKSRIHCVVQGEKLGPLHAIQEGFKSVSKDSRSITVWLGDTICLDKFDWDQNFLAVHSVPDPHRWCLVDEGGLLYDKPDSAVPTDKALIGVYNFTDIDSFRESLEEGMKKPTHKGEHQISALLSSYMERKGPMALINTHDWYDCGELNTYYESKARLLTRTARSFNQIHVDTFYGTVTKSSQLLDKKKKIELEKYWFSSITEQQSLFCPRVLESEYGVLRMTLEPGVALNEVLVYDNLRTDVWHEILRKVLNVHHKVFYTRDHLSWENQSALCSINYRRSLERKEEIFEALQVEQEQRNLVNKFLTNTISHLEKNPRWSKVIHGDSHLGNIIYDAHSGSIKFVDPRGSFGDQEGTAGDMRYDMAKLLQDFYCGYAMIMANRYWWDGEEVNIEWVPGTEELCRFLEAQLQELDYDVELLKKLSVVLLITAIPFHQDNQERQKAMFSRGIQLIS
jgi:glucose-1-phosphate thymidylyltransferase